MLQKNFKILLFTSGLLAYFLPYSFSFFDSNLVLVLTSLVLFVNYFTINIEDLKKTNPLKFSKFYLIRFVISPYLFSFLIFILDTNSVLALTLIACMPGGVTAPAFTNIYKGNVSICVMLVVVSSFFAPLTTFLIMKNLLGNTANFSTLVLFKTLLIAIFVPYILHIPFTFNSKIKNYIVAKSSDWSIILTLLNIFISVQLTRGFISNNLIELLYYLFLVIIAFIVFYILPWIFFRKTFVRKRIAYTFASGANNTGLALALSLLYFPNEVSVIIILSAIPWTFALWPFEVFMLRRGH